MNINQRKYFDDETKQKTTITFNRVIVLLDLTRCFVYSIYIIWEGFQKGGVGNNAVFFLLADVQKRSMVLYRYIK